MSTQKPHCRPGTTDAMQRLADENEALRAERDGLAARVARLSEKAHQLSYDLIHSLHDDFPKDCDSSFGLLQDTIAESPAQSLAHIRAAGAREALERAMKTPVFSDTVVRVDLMREIIEKMEKDNG